MAIANWYKHLSDAQKGKLLKEYDMLPLTPKGRRNHFQVIELARKWGVSVSYVRGVVMKRSRGE